MRKSLKSQEKVLPLPSDHRRYLLLHVRMRDTLLDSLARSVFPAPRAFPTRTLAATEKPMGICRARRKTIKGELEQGRGPLRRWRYHICCGSQLMHDGLSCQLHLTDDTGQESCDLIQPPLQTAHQHTGHGQLEEGTPLLQALSGPAFRRRRNAFTAVMAVAFVKTFHFVGNSKPNWMLNIAGKDLVCSFLYWKPKT